MGLGVWGDLTILAAVMAATFASCVFVNRRHNRVAAECSCVTWELEVSLGITSRSASSGMDRQGGLR